jgi:hypothetical protein
MCSRLLQYGFAVDGGSVLDAIIPRAKEDAERVA